MVAGEKFSDIEWVQVCHNDAARAGDITVQHFCGMNRAQTESVCGFDACMNESGSCLPEGANLRDFLAEFNDWQAEVPFA